MTNTNSILSMTEHAAYVWPGYAAAAVILIGLVIVSLLALKKTRAELAEAEQAAEQRADEA
ncbi:MAG: heme exporter protein CcmD [Rhodospirillales bacterium]